jgi:hypothetical protein
LPIGSSFPALWLTSYDASNPSEGIHCHAVNPLLARAADRALRLLPRL